MRTSNIGNNICIVFILLLSGCNLNPEYTNEINSEGQRDGYWKLYLDNILEPTRFEAFAPYYALLEYDDGEIDSEVTILFRTGELYWQGNLQTFTPFSLADGEHVFYHRNGKKSAQFTLVDGKRHGITQEWYENEVMEREYYANNGVYDGTYREWFESGNPKYACTYNLGQLDKVETEWDIEGFKTKEVHWNKGRKSGTETTWFSSDRIGSYTEWQDNILHGRKMYYDGGFKIVEFYRFGQLNGVREEYWTNGDLRVTTTFLDGKKHGPETGYYRDGKKQSVINWEHDVENGICRVWYPNGTLEHEWTYAQGEQHGIQMAWDSTGKVKSKSRWDHGKYLGRTDSR